MSGWIVTASDVRFELFDPRPEMVNIGDIAHGLSNLCRFNGHTHAFYSVAQHSVLVAMHSPEDERLTALLHDATEAYVGDMVRPLKKSLPAYKEAEDRIWEVIRERFNLGPISAAIKEADDRALMTERRDLLGPSRHRWETLLEERAIPFDEVIVPMSPVEARMGFLRLFTALVSRRVVGA